MTFAVTEKGEINNVICIPKYLLKEAINTFGVDSQLNIAVEELSELIKEICKAKRYSDRVDVYWYNSLCEEMADVIIMIEQLQMIFDNKEDVEKYVNEKLNRLTNLIDEHRIKQEAGEVCGMN